MASSKLYELRIDSGRLSNMARALEIVSNVMPELKTKSPPLGAFTTDIGKLNQYVQIYQFADYDAREAEIHNLPVDNPSWASANSALRELYDTQECITMRSAYQGPLQVPSSGPGGYYFLYKFTFCRETYPNNCMRASGLEEVLNKYITRTGLTCLGMWTPELGEETLSIYYVLFHTAKLESPTNPALTHKYHRDEWKTITRHIFVKSISGQMLRPCPWGRAWK